MALKAQSAIEYLMTYGWMLLAVTIVGGAAYQISSPAECSLQTTGFYSEDINIEDQAITSNNEFVLALTSMSEENITVKEVEVSDSENSILQTRVTDLETNSPKSYRVADINQSYEECMDAEMRIRYNKGFLEDQRIQGTINIPANLVEPITNMLLTGGGQISVLNVQSSVMVSEAASNGSICIGDQCNTIQEDTEERVQRSGDEMTGTLGVDNMQHDCMGDLCTYETGSYDGNVTYQNNTMDGTLNVTEIKPLTNLCFGQC